MKKTHVPNSIRREESDTRIINASIKIFGLYGYTSSTVSKIAKEAGVSPGLITKRYASKEDLFFDVVNHAFLKVQLDAENVVSAKEFLVNIVKAFVKLSKEEPESFRFISMLLGSSDIPYNSDSTIHEVFIHTKAYELLKDEQSKGIIPDGDIQHLLSAYISHVSIHVNMCKIHNMDLPSDEFFLSMLPFENKELKLKRKWDGILAKILFDTFETMSYVNIVDNCGEEIRKTDYSTAELTDDVHKRIIDITRERVSENDVQKVCDFFDFSTISERFGSNNFTFIDYLGKDSIKYRHILFSLNRDNKGKIIDMIAFVQKLAS